MKKNLYQTLRTRDKITGLIILALVAIILLSRSCDTPSPSKPGLKPDTVIVYDTIYKRYDSVIYKKVPVHIEIPPHYVPPQYIPDTNYSKLKEQYNALAQKFLAKKVYLDSVAVGTYGHIKVKDTLTENSLVSRTYEEDFAIPTIKETITITKPAEPRRQLYVGGGINMTRNYGLDGAKVGLLYKTKKDKLFGVNSQINLNGNITFGIESYWLINLKPKK